MMREILEQAVKEWAFQYAVVPTSVLVFSPDVIRACETNVCGNYNKYWTCPPALGSLESNKEKITAFAYALVFTTKSCLEDSFDFEGMMKAKDVHNTYTVKMHEKFGRTNPVYGAGNCTVCEIINADKTCAYPEPCRFPDRIYPSIEAAGINVVELSRTAGLGYHNGENTVTYFSMILFDD
jgi:predicted metal-binding protein